MTTWMDVVDVELVSEVQGKPELNGSPSNGGYVKSTSILFPQKINHVSIFPSSPRLFGKAVFAIKIPP